MTGLLSQFFTWLHPVCCTALAGAAVYWRVRHPAEQSAHRFLFPFIVAAGLAGCLAIVVPGFELFVAMYSGSVVDWGVVDVLGWKLDSRIVAAVMVLLALLPGFGILPAIGRRPLLVATLALLPLAPLAIFR